LNVEVVNGVMESLTTTSRFEGCAGSVKDVRMRKLGDPCRHVRQAAPRRRARRPDDRLANGAGGPLAATASPMYFFVAASAFAVRAATFVTRLPPAFIPKAATISSP
jgi:hypothetical protein